MKTESKKVLEKPLTSRTPKKRREVCSAFVGKTYSRVVKEYGYYYDNEKRDRVFGVIGEKPVADEIASHKAECDMSFIKEHLLQNGSDVIDEALMGDCSHISSDLLTNLNLAETAKQAFYRLPTAIRERYDNNINKFANEFNPEHFVKKVDVIEKVENKEVKKDENKE